MKINDEVIDTTLEQYVYPLWFKKFREALAVHDAALTVAGEVVSDEAVEAAARVINPSGHHLLCNFEKPCNCYFQHDRNKARTALDAAAPYMGHDTVQAIGLRAIEDAQAIGDREGIETGSLTWWYGEALERGARIGNLTRDLATALTERGLNTPEVYGQDSAGEVENADWLESVLSTLAVEAQTATTPTQAFHLAIRAVHAARRVRPVVESAYWGAVRSRRAIEQMSGVTLADYPKGAIPDVADAALDRATVAERDKAETALAALVAGVRDIKTHNGTPVTPENLVYAATHEAMCRSWIFDVLQGLARLLPAVDAGEAGE